MEAARETFYRAYTHRDGDRSDLVTVDNILKQLKFSPLQITLFAGVAHHNNWDVAEQCQWLRRHAHRLADNDECPEAIVRLSLSSLQRFGSEKDVRALLAVIAFFPQGIVEDKLDCLSARVHPGKRKEMFETFSSLSLTYRSDGFTTMEEPLRRYFYPQNPKFAPFLTEIKNEYFGLLLANDIAGPGEPGFEAAKWIIPVDVNVEHLLDIFTKVDAESDRVWRACADFMRHLFYHKPRMVALGPKIEALPDDHPYKPACLFQLSRLFGAVGNQVESKRLLARVLELSGGEGTTSLPRVYAFMGLHGEEMRHVQEALGISEPLGDTEEQVQCLLDFALRSVRSDD